MKNDLLLSNVLSAKSDVTAAEDALATLLRELGAMPRAEKTTISKGLEAAFEKLRAAREHLGVLEKLAGGEDE